MLNLLEYGFDQDHQDVYDLVYRYSRDELHPLLDKMDREDWFPEDQFRAMSKIGLLGTTVPDAYGGPGMDYLAQCVASEAMAYWNHCMAASWMANENVCIHNIVRNGNEEQRERLLPKFVSGDYIGALGLTEPGAGSDALGSMATTAQTSGDKYILNGRKMFITNGPVADVVLVYAKTDAASGHHGISAFLVETSAKGFSCAQKLDKMGWRGSPTGELVLEDCEVPAKNLLGKENGGVALAMSGLNIERSILGFFNIGIAQRALDISVDYAKTREQFNRPIASFQLIQGMLADMYTAIESMRSFVYDVAKRAAKLEAGEGGRGDIHKLTAASMLYSGRATMDVLDKAVQIHGGMGFMRECEANILYRSGKLMEIGGGTNEIRQTIIAGELLR